jgi:hypothetical protein
MMEYLNWMVDHPVASVLMGVFVLCAIEAIRGKK